MYNLQHEDGIEVHRKNIVKRAISDVTHTAP